MRKVFRSLSGSCSLLAFLVLPASGAQAQTEVGDNDFRISFLQGTGDPDFDAFDAAVAYNPAANEFLVVWTGTFRQPSPICPPGRPPEAEIFARRVDGSTGQLLGSPIVVSSMGPTCDSTYGAFIPAVAYNSADDEYLVVWQGDDDTGGLIDNEFEIFGQRLSATGSQIGADDFRISDLGGTGDSRYDASEAAVAYNPAADEYLVVWYGDDSVGGLVDNEGEIFGQRLDAGGEEVGANDFRISDAGGIGDASRDALSPAVAYNPTADEYLVVWQANDSDAGLLEDELEIFGQRLNANGTAQGVNDFRISDMGGIGQAGFPAESAAVACDPDDDEYLVVWQGQEDVGVVDNYEIFVQRLDASGAEVGGNDVQISDMGGTGTFDYAGLDPVVVYNPTDREYLVAWWGDDDVGGLAHFEYEIFVQRLDASGAEVGENDFRISDMGGTGENPFNAYFPALAWGRAANHYLVAWDGDDDVGGLVDDEFEIFGQRLAGTVVFADGFESGDTSAWSATVP